MGAAHVRGVPIPTMGAATLSAVKPCNCPRCDFASGRRGMDRCFLCDGTGSLLRVGRRFFPNTKTGHEEASQVAAFGPSTAPAVLASSRATNLDERGERAT